jgi:hypothetical protein
MSESDQQQHGFQKTPVSRSYPRSRPLMRRPPSTVRLCLKAAGEQSIPTLRYRVSAGGRSCLPCAVTSLKLTYEPGVERSVPRKGQSEAAPPGRIPIISGAPEGRRTRTRCQSDGVLRHTSGAQIQNAPGPGVPLCAPPWRGRTSLYPRSSHSPSGMKIWRTRARRLGLCSTAQVVVGFRVILISFY